MFNSSQSYYDDISWEESIFCLLLTSKFKSEPDLYKKINKTADNLKIVLLQYKVEDVLKDKYCPLILAEYIENIVNYCSENFDYISLQEWMEVLQVYCESHVKFAHLFIRQFAVVLINKIITPKQNWKGELYKKYLLYIINYCIFKTGYSKILDQNEEIVVKLISYLNDCCELITQIRVVELAIRLCSKSELLKSLKKLHFNFELNTQFMAITKEDFDATVRQFLNKLNAHNYHQRILSVKFSVGYLIMPKENWLIQDESKSGQCYWLDFNWLSETITFDANFGDKISFSQISKASTEPIEDTLTIIFDDIIAIKSFTWKAGDGIYLDISMNRPCYCDRRSLLKIVAKSSNVVFFIKNCELLDRLHEKLEEIFGERYKDKKKDINENMRTKLCKIENVDVPTPSYNKRQLQGVRLPLFAEEGSRSNTSTQSSQYNKTRTSQLDHTKESLSATDEELSQNSDVYQPPISPNYYESEPFIPVDNQRAECSYQGGSKVPNKNTNAHEHSQKSQNIICDLDVMSQIKLFNDNITKRPLGDRKEKTWTLQKIEKPLNLESKNDSKNEVVEISSDSEGDELLKKISSFQTNFLQSLKNLVEQKKLPTEESSVKKLINIKNVEIIPPGTSRFFQNLSQNDAKESYSLKHFGSSTKNVKDELNQNSDSNLDSSDSRLCLVNRSPCEMEPKKFYPTLQKPIHNLKLSPDETNSKQFINATPVPSSFHLSARPFEKKLQLIQLNKSPVQIKQKCRDEKGFNALEMNKNELILARNASKQKKYGQTSSNLQNDEKETSLTSIEPPESRHETLVARNETISKNQNSSTKIFVPKNELYQFESNLEPSAVRESNLSDKDTQKEDPKTSQNIDVLSKKTTSLDKILSNPKEDQNLQKASLMVTIPLERCSSQSQSSTDSQNLPFVTASIKNNQIELQSLSSQSSSEGQTKLVVENLSLKKSKSINNLKTIETKSYAKKSLSASKNFVRTKSLPNIKFDKKIKVSPTIFGPKKSKELKNSGERNIFLDETLKRVETDSEPMKSGESQKSSPKVAPKDVKRSRSVEGSLSQEESSQKEKTNFDIFDSVGLAPKSLSPTPKKFKRSQSEVDISKMKDMGPKEVEEPKRKRGRPRKQDLLALPQIEKETASNKVLTTPKRGRKKKQEDPDWKKHTPRKTRSRSKKSISPNITMELPELNQGAPESSSDKSDENDKEVENIFKSERKDEAKHSNLENTDPKEGDSSRSRSRSRSKTPVRLLNEIQTENIIDVDNNYEITFSDWGRPQRRAKTPTRLINEVLRKSPHYFRSEDKLIFDDNTDNYALTSQYKNDKTSVGSTETIISSNLKNQKVTNEVTETKLRRRSCRSNTTSVKNEENAKGDSLEHEKLPSCSEKQKMAKKTNKKDLFDQIKVQVSPNDISKGKTKTKSRSRSSSVESNFADNNLNNDLFDQIREHSPPQEVPKTIMAQKTKTMSTRSSTRLNSSEESPNNKLFNQIRDQSPPKDEPKNKLDPKTNSRTRSYDTGVNSTEESSNNKLFDLIRDEGPQKSGLSTKIKPKNALRSPNSSLGSNFSERDLKNDLFDQVRDGAPPQNVPIRPKNVLNQNLDLVSKVGNPSSSYLSDEDLNNELFDKVRCNRAQQDGLRQQFDPIREKVPPKSVPEQNLDLISTLRSPTSASNSTDVFDQLRDNKSPPKSTPKNDFHQIRDQILTKKVTKPNLDIISSIWSPSGSNTPKKKPKEDFFDQIRDKGAPQNAPKQKINQVEGKAWPKNTSDEKLDIISGGRRQSFSVEVNLTEERGNNEFFNDQVFEQVPPKVMMDPKPKYTSLSSSAGSNLSAKDLPDQLAGSQKGKRYHRGRSASVGSSLTSEQQNIDPFDKLKSDTPLKTRTRKRSSDSSQNSYLNPPQTAKRVRSKSFDVNSGLSSSKKGKRKLFNLNDPIPDDISQENTSTTNLRNKFDDIFDLSDDEDNKNDMNAIKEHLTFKKGSKTYLRIISPKIRSRPTSKVNLLEQDDKRIEKTIQKDLEPMEEENQEENLSPGNIKLETSKTEQTPKKRRPSGPKTPKTKKSPKSKKVPTFEDLFGSRKIKNNENLSHFPSPPFTSFSQSSSIIGDVVKTRTSRIFGNLPSNSEENTPGSTQENWGLPTKRRTRKSKEKKSNIGNKKGRKIDSSRESSFLDDADNTGGDGKVLEIAMKHIMLNAQYIKEIFKKNKNSARRTALYKKYCKEKFKQLNDSEDYFKLHAEM